MAVSLTPRENADYHIVYLQFRWCLNLEFKLLNNTTAGETREDKAIDGHQDRKPRIIYS